MTPDIAIAWLLFNVFLVVLTLIWGIFRFRKGVWYRKLILKFQAYLLWGIGGIALLSSISPFSYLYTEHLWYFENVGYSDVFWKIRQVKWGLFAGFFFIAFAFLNINGMIAKRLCPEPREFARWTRDRTVAFHRVFFCGTVLVALILAVPMMSLNDVLIRYLERSVEKIEPFLLGKDRNFFLFSFPLHQSVSLWVNILLWTTCVFVGLLYNYYYRRDARSKGYVKRNIVIHGTVLWLMLLAAGVWGSYVNLWGKVYTKSATPTLNTFHGFFFMDDQLVGSTLIYCLVLLAIGIAIITNLFWRKRLLWYFTLVVWCVSYLSLIHVYPRLSHYVIVQNDKLIPEGQFLANHIESTRAAFDLNTIKDRRYTAGKATLELVDNSDNREVLENVQLWDRRVLYDVLQAEHNVEHHNFSPYTDIDRYYVTPAAEPSVEDENDLDKPIRQYRQVLIAAREIEPDREVVGDRGNWRGRKLFYTHGYGVYVVPANVVDKESPLFWSEVKMNSDNIRNETFSPYPELKITQPRIYYGELTNDYVIANTTVNEYSFESDVSDVLLEEEDQDKSEQQSEEEQKNSEPRNKIALEKEIKYFYDGTGGVRLSSWFRRFCFAIRFLDFQILYNKDNVLTSDSRIMYWRKIGTRQGQKVISDRLSHIAPFLDYDPDPYIVIADGELWWIVDFYITSKWYPNAQFYTDDTAKVPVNMQNAEFQYKKFNYIRNAGVATVNAFSGDVNFYAIKDNEAIISSYRKVFPHLFKGKDEMPQRLREHLRFPDYLTRIQAKIYKDYYVKDVVTFANKTRPLKIPKEVYGAGQKTDGGSMKWNDDQEMMPYYAMIRLPGESRMEFVNMIPFTPKKKEHDMKAWLVARCDPPDYGERIVYTLNNTPEVKGPKHAENLITSGLSNKFLSLSTGNLVMRSSLQFIPLDDGILYVESIYQKPDTSEDTDGKQDGGASRPFLKDVVVVANDVIGSDPSFSKALRKAVEIGIEADQSGAIETTPNGENGEELNLAEQFEILLKAVEEFGKALKSAENGNVQGTHTKASGNKKNNK